MTRTIRPTIPLAAFVPVLAVLAAASCSQQPDDGADPKVTTLGTIEVTAQLVEVLGTFPPNDLYDYVYVLKYRILATHRGAVAGDTILVGQYNPLKPRARAADVRAERIGGTLKAFEAGDFHRMALEVPLDEHYMGPIINKYFGKEKALPYWAVWADKVAK